MKSMVIHIICFGPEFFSIPLFSTLGSWPRGAISREFLPATTGRRITHLSRSLCAFVQLSNKKFPFLFSEG
jgi:hypothetical protein